MLAMCGQLEYMWSQPLIRACYTPVNLLDVFAVKQKRQQKSSTKSRLTEQDREDFRIWFSLLHETTHLWFLDWTPAKELAKVYLARCYDLILRLVFDEKPSWLSAESYWKSIELLEERLKQIEQNIVFVEELIAAVVSLGAMKTQVQPGGMWTGFHDELELLKAEALAVGDRFFPGFEEDFENITPLLRWMSNNPSVASHVVPLLQPIDVNVGDKLPRALDARSNLYSLVQLVDGVESAEEALLRLQPLIKESIQAWKIVLGIQIEMSQEAPIKEGGRWTTYGRIAQALLRVSRAALEDGSVDSTGESSAQMIKRVQSTISAGSPVGASTLAVLRRYTHKDRSFIGFRWLDGSEPTLAGAVQEEIKGDQLVILMLEGLREQLLAKRGIVCPCSVLSKQLNRGGCQCRPVLRRGLVRLSEWAQDGLFGPGEWSPLPCKRWWDGTRRGRGYHAR